MLGKAVREAGFLKLRCACSGSCGSDPRWEPPVGEGARLKPHPSVWGQEWGDLQGCSSGSDCPPKLGQGRPPQALLWSER